MAPEVPAELREALREYRRLLVARFGERLDRLALFGSQARGEATAESDVDVLVCIREASSREESAAAALAGDVVNTTGVWLSPTVYSTERFSWLLSTESPFATRIVEEQLPL